MLIHILMATYNGERYLGEQLDSIAGQTETQWKLHVRDDGSQDGTWQLLHDFAESHPGKVELARNDERLGAKGNFARLLQEVQEPGDYAFCDQDDVWELGKLHALQKKLREIEGLQQLQQTCEESQKLRGNQKNMGRLEEGIMPALVYSDASVINQAGEVVSESFAEQTGVFLPERRVMESLLLCNFVQGAAAMWNGRLQKILGRHAMPQEALMHDWWLALVAAGHGRIAFLPEKLSRYRQHDGNAVGGFDRQAWHGTVRRKLGTGRIGRLVESNHRMLELRRQQAEAYERLYGDRRVRRYLEIDRKRPKICRAYLGIREGYIFLSKAYSVKYYMV